MESCSIDKIIATNRLKMILDALASPDDPLTRCLLHETTITDLFGIAEVAGARIDINIDFLRQ